ncbi:FUN14 domain-containing protein [Thermoproteota archaeon]
MEDLIAPIMFMLGIGGLTGYFSGKLVRRISGMAMAIGVVAFIVIALVYTGNFNVNIDSITANISNVLSYIAPLGIVALASSVPFVASFVAGLFIGYRRY